MSNQIIVQLITKHQRHWTDFLFKNGKVSDVSGLQPFSLHLERNVSDVDQRPLKIQKNMDTRSVKSDVSTKIELIKFFTFNPFEFDGDLQKSRLSQSIHRGCLLRRYHL